MFFNASSLDLKEEEEEEEEEGTHKKETPLQDTEADYHGKEIKKDNTKKTTRSRLCRQANLYAQKTVKQKTGRTFLRFMPFTFRLGSPFGMFFSKCKRE